MNDYRFEDIKVGMSEGFTTVVTAAMMQRFLETTGDNNPLHTDQGYSQSRGHKGRVVYGMLTASFYSTLVGVYLPGKNALLQGIDISFNKPVYEGDQLTIFGEVSYINEAFKQIEIKAHIENQEKVKVSKAKIRAGVYEQR